MSWQDGQIRLPVCSQDSDSNLITNIVLSLNGLAEYMAHVSLEYPGTNGHFRLPVYSQDLGNNLIILYDQEVLPIFIS